MKYLLDSHTHTLVSGHAYNTITEMVHAAAQKGLELIALTEHGPAMPGSCASIYFKNMKVIPRRMEGIRVLFGCELNILDFSGGVDLDEETISRLDVGIASLHSVCIDPGSCSQNTSAYLGAMKNPGIHIIGHPDDGKYEVDYDTLACAAKEHHVLLEVNNHSLEPGCHRINARQNVIRMLEACMKHKTRVILDSDAHWSGSVGERSYSEALLEEIAFPEELVVNGNIDLYLSYLYTDTSE